MAYSTSADIKLGNIPLPGYLDVTRVINDAADEIDSYIGFIYKTPIDVTEDGPVVRPARLLLKRISIALVTGRIVLEVAAAAEDESLHAYGARQLREAHQALEDIRSGKIDLDGAEKVPDETERTRGPLIANVDPVSNVESFYEYFKPTNLLDRFGGRVP